MGILDITSNIKVNKNKIPDYAKDYKNEYLFIRGIDNLTLAGNLKIYIEEAIMKLKIQKVVHDDNWGKIIIYEMILSLVNHIIEYFNNPTEYRLTYIHTYIHFIDAP